MVERIAWIAALAAGGLMLAGAAGRAAEVRVPVIADTSICAAAKEVTINHGARSVIRIKGIQHFMLMKFDVSAIRGWTVDRALLHLHSARPEHRLRTMGVSTVSADWSEGEGQGGGPDEGGCCFTHARYPTDLWAGPQSDFTDVAFGVGNTLAHYTDIREPDGTGSSPTRGPRGGGAPNGWLEIDVPPQLVQALVCGNSYGLVVSDEKGQTFANNDVHSREQSQYQPYMTVTGVARDRRPPVAIGDPRALALPRAADFDTGAVELQFTSPTDDGPEGRAFSYRVSYRRAGDAEEMSLPRYLTPHPKAAGEPERIVVPGLAPGESYSFSVVAVDAAGNASEPATVEVRASGAKPLPASLPTVASGSQQGPEPSAHGGKLRVWACGDCQKVHPVSGNLLEEAGDEAYAGPPRGRYRRGNYIWDGAASTIRLAGGRNEFVAFQLIIEASARALHDVRVGMSDLSGPRGAKLPAAGHTELFKVWYVRDGEPRARQSPGDGGWFPEVAVPLTGEFEIPDPENAIDGQRNQSVFVDLYIPHDAPAGDYTGRMTVSADGVPAVSVPIALTAWPLVLPDTLTFEVELNCYGPFGRDFGISGDGPEYPELELKYHRLTHAHRTTINSLAYTHSGRVHAGYVPPVEGRGAAMGVTDWAAWDERFGRYLDGSAFADLPRAGVPLSHMYLPFHEAWPADIREHYRWAPTTTEYPEMIVQHALTAPPVEEAFDEEYKAAFVAISREFAEHFRERGWTQTRFQFYLNNKRIYKRNGGRATSWWLLDEPMHRDDWLALRFFGEMFKRGVEVSPPPTPPQAGGRGTVQFVFRGDISRPQWQRDWLDGLVDLMCVSRTFFSKNRRCMAMRTESGIEFWNYGTANEIKLSNLNAEAWPVKVYLAGGDGLLPWQTIGRDANFTEPAATALLYPGKRFGIMGPLASLRLKALRRGQQDVEYLALLAEKKGLDRPQLARLAASTLDLRAVTAQAFLDDAGRTVFESLQAEQFHRLRAAIAAALAAD